ncbi:hypothetical protein NHX12_012084 [Muraenolepis orangiensis]|uniref:Reverse transcriptase RNase H-like domain-containing protein n=1 Tax=Muraenolepis orangiensis TaxID=630683 RepID=A0A9Q0I6A6_9TELE|nr:hypothetical protein NHX12_012084 [Muraenolepis orangiensis]
MKEPEGQLARWLERLGEYNFEIVHRPGRLHSNADSLSRIPCRQSCPCDAKSSGGRETLSFHSSESSGGREILSFHSSESSGGRETLSFHSSESSGGRAILSIHSSESSGGREILSFHSSESSGGRETLSFHSSESSGGREILSFHSSESSGGKQSHRTTTNNTTGLFCGWSPEELRQAQEADPDIGPIRAWMETSNERPPWVTVSPCSPATKTYWSQWKRLYLKDTILVRRLYCLDVTVLPTSCAASNLPP